MNTDYEYEYRVVPVGRLPQLQEDIDRLKHSGQLSDNPTYRGYLDQISFALPENFPEAKSLIVLARFTPAVLVNFWLDGTAREVVIPPQYYSTGLKIEDLQQEIRTKVIGDPSARLERATVLHLKLLAVRSGLGRYGRNNICYVGEMGSFITLFAFFTDHDLGRDDWEEIRFLDLCEKCQVCLKNCPTGAIRTDSPVIDAGRCITLYNEDVPPFPDWIPADVHNALMGCTRCQWPCPANKKALQRIGRLEDVSAEETRALLSDQPGEAVIQSVSEKLRLPHMPGSKEVQTAYLRNLRILLEKPAE